MRLFITLIAMDMLLFGTAALAIVHPIASKLGL